jgi:hypothetical protein
VAIKPPDKATEDVAEFRPTIAVTAKGVLPVESLLVARYQLFNALYWHHTARASTVVLQYLVWRYLCPRSDKSDRYASRLAPLLSSFRELPDRAALEWLSTQFGTGPSRFQNLAWAARDREGLPQTICELSYADLLHRPAWVERYKMLMEWHQALNQQPAGEYSRCRARIIEHMCDIILKFVRSKKGTVPPGLRGLDEMVLFPDVPLGFRDQVRNLYVIVRTGDDSAVTPFEQHSPIAEAIRGAFRIWSRKVRVFVMPEAFRALNEALSGRDLEMIAFEGLVEAYEIVMSPKVRQPSFLAQLGI